MKSNLKLQTTIIFPGFIGNTFLKDSTDDIRFVKDGLGIAVIILNENSLTFNTKKKEKIVESITAQISTIDDLIPQFMALSNDSSDSFFTYEYNVNSAVEQFRIEEHQTPAYRRKLFEALAKLKKIPYEFFAKEYANLRELAEYIEQNDKRILYLQNNSLKEIAKLTLRVYKNAIHLEQINTSDLI